MWWQGGLTEAGISLSPKEDPCVRPEKALPKQNSCWKLLQTQQGPRLPARSAHLGTEASH